MKHELQNIISGKSQVEHGTNIQAIASYLRNGKGASGLAEKSIVFKKQEASLIEQFAIENKLWISDLDVKNFVSNGAEQDGILKFIDTVFYLTAQFYK
jgi:hypothetical protein